METDTPAFASGIFKSPDMEGLYSDSKDPWSNRSRGIYEILLKELVVKLTSSSHLQLQSRPLRLFDLGCGGGNVVFSFQQAFESLGWLIEFGGVDISESAVQRLQAEVPLRIHQGKFQQFDLEQYVYDPAVPAPWSSHDIVSMVDVLYYFGSKRSWKTSLHEIWKGMSSGTLFVLSDTLIRQQYRDFPKTFEDATLLYSYTDRTIPASPPGHYPRYLKIRVYQKQ